ARHVQRGVRAGPVRVRERARGHPERRGDRDRGRAGPVHRLRLDGEPAGGRGMRRRFTAGKAAALLLATVWLVVVVAPLYYMILASFRTQGTYLTDNPWVPSGGLSTSSYGTVFDAGLGRYLLNSVVLTAVCIALTVTISLGAAFRIVRRGSRAVGV